MTAHALAVRTGATTVPEPATTPERLLAGEQALATLYDRLSGPIFGPVLQREPIPRDALGVHR